MYLSRKQQAALSLALDAMENGRGSDVEEQNKAIDTIVDMLHSAQRARGRRRRAARKAEPVEWVISDTYVAGGQ